MRSDVRDAPRTASLTGVLSCGGTLGDAPTLAVGEEDIGSEWSVGCEERSHAQSLRNLNFCVLGYGGLLPPPPALPPTSCDIIPLRDTVWSFLSILPLRASYMVLGWPNPRKAAWELLSCMVWAWEQIGDKVPFFPVGGPFPLKLGPVTQTSD